MGFLDAERVKSNLATVGVFPRSRSSRRTRAILFEKLGFVCVGARMVEKTDSRFELSGGASSKGAGELRLDVGPKGGAWGL